jgi:large subunit ribosomal protein L29
MKMAELENFSVDELRQKEKTLKKELFELNFKRKIGQVEHPHRFRAARRAIARILTVIRQKETGKNGKANQ